MTPITNSTHWRDRHVGWFFAPAAAASLGFVSGAVFALNQFHPRSLATIAIELVLVAIGALLILVAQRTSGWLSDLALGVGGGGVAATLIVGLATAGGAG